MALEKTEQRYWLFAQTYAKNGHNALQAYKTISPNVTDNTANVEGPRYLAKPRVQELLAEFEAQIAAASKITAETIISELREIQNDTDDPRVKIMAIQEQAKIVGLYSPTRTETKGKIEVTNLNDLTGIPADDKFKKFKEWEKKNEDTHR